MEHNGFNTNGWSFLAINSNKKKKWRGKLKYFICRFNRRLEKERDQYRICIDSEPSEP